MSIEEFPQTQESQVYADVVMSALKHVASEMRGGADLGAMLGALAFVQAHFISGIADVRMREATVKSVRQMFDQQLAEFLRDGSGPSVEMIQRKRS